MTRSHFAIIIAVFGSACAGKAVTSESVDPLASPEPATSSTTVDIPKDSASKKFASKLVSLEIHDWSPEDSGQVSFTYEDFSFNSDGTWSATGTVAILDESVDCRESGHWTMDPAASEDSSFLDWTVEDTTCPGRESGSRVRVKMVIDKDGSFEVFLH